MPPEAIEPETTAAMTLTGLAVLTAIPVVIYALWCAYFEQYFDQMMEDKAKIDRREELARIRTANFFSLLFQFAIYLGSGGVRHEHPLVAYPLFLGAILAQFWIQLGLERKVRVRTGESQSFVADALRSFFWSTMAGALYLVVLLSTVFLFSLVGAALKTPPAVSLTLLILGVAAGVIGGLCLSFGLGPFFVRRIFRSSALNQGELFERLSADFVRAGLPLPRFWMIEVEQFHAGSAMMAGFRSGNGLFQPALFITKAAIDSLSSEELRSVILHEISHVRLNHLKKRFFFSSGLIICASLITGMFVLLAGIFFPSGPSQALVGCFSVLFCFSTAFKFLAEQTKFQEISADIYSIEKLGGDLPTLANALRKLDRLNDELPFRKEMGSMLLSMGHPATERRIRILELYFERRHRAQQAGGGERAGGQAA